jgi:thiol-disulfide isomerase/thioredoxin
MKRFYHIHKNQVKEENDKNKALVDNFIKSREKGNTFVLIFMDGCGPCNETRPEWNKLENILDEQILKDNDVIIVDVDTNYTEDMKSLEAAPSFPTMRFITKNGTVVENYVDSSLDNKDRTIDSFVDWIKLKLGKTHVTKKEVNSQIKSTGNRKNKSKKRKNKSKKNKSKSKKNKSRKNKSRKNKSKKNKSKKRKI